MENDTDIYQRQNNFTKSALRARDCDARCVMGGEYGMGNRRNGVGCGFGDRRCNLHYDEKMSAPFKKNVGQNQPVITPS